MSKVDSDSVFSQRTSNVMFYVFTKTHPDAAITSTMCFSFCASEKLVKNSNFMTFGTASKPSMTTMIKISSFNLFLNFQSICITIRYSTAVARRMQTTG